MSSFLVGSKTINSIVTHLGHKRNFEGHQREIVETLGSDYDVRTELGRTNLGQYMWDLNLEAFAGRYAHNPEWVKKSNFAPYEYDLMLDCSEVQVIKNLGCFLYQCTEDATIKHPLYELLGKIEKALMYSYISRLPEYDQASWGFLG